MAVTIDGTTGVSAVQAGAVERGDLFAGFANGITEADYFYLTTDITGTNGVISSNLDRLDFTGTSTLGTGMTKDVNGVFTFPSTGIYEVACYFTVGNNGAGGSDRAGITSNVTVNGGASYTMLTNSQAAVDGETAGGFANGSSSIFVDVTDTSNVKVRFETVSLAGTTYIDGNASYLRTYFTFIRLGDT